MHLADDALREHRRGDRYTRRLCERDGVRLEAVPVQFDAGDDHRTVRGLDPPHRLAHSLGQGGRVTAPHGLRVRSDLVRCDRHHVAGQFEVHRPLEPVRRVEEQVDVAERGGRIDDFPAGGADLLEDLQLCPPFADAMVQERIVRPLPHAGCARDHHDRALLRVGAGDRVGDAHAPHAVGHAQGAHAVHAGVRIGREPGAVLAGAVHEVERAVLQHAVEREHVVARQTEDVANPVVGKPPDQVLADRETGNAFRPLHGRPGGGGSKAVVQTRAEHDRHGSPPARTGGTQREHDKPEAEERQHASEHDQRAAWIVVQSPGTEGEHGPPGGHRRHDPRDPAGGRIHCAIIAARFHVPILDRIRLWCGAGSAAGQRSSSAWRTPEAPVVHRKQRPPERSRSQGGGEPEPFPGAIGRHVFWGGPPAASDPTAGIRATVGFDRGPFVDSALSLQAGGQ